jgi:serine/threonine-protein kinase
MAVATGQSFGNFRIVRLLGEGGFGEVYEAENPFLQRRAAVKVLHAAMVQDAELVRRFLNEARAASAIRHPHIIEVFDAGVTPEGEPYILMEFLEGDSLQKLLQQQGRMPLGTVQEIAQQAGSALSAAHAAGIVHRDLKPENIFLVPDALLPLGFRVKVLDFGIAKIKHRDDQGSTLKTQAGLLMGSPAYMSPEQCRDSSDVDLRTDIYSLAIMVYEMLAGVPPFSSKSATEMLVMQLTADPPPLRRQAPELPEYVEQAVMRALAKDREMRYSSVDYFVGALLGTYPAQTAQGNAAAGLGIDRSPGQSMYSTRGYGYQKTPPPVSLDSLGSRMGLTPAPLSSTTITTFSQATGEASPSPSPSTSASEVELDSMRPRRWPIIVVVGALAVAAGVIFVVRAGPFSVPPKAPTAAPSVEPAAARAPAALNVHLQVRSSPAGATVLDAKDGNVLGVTPLEKTYPQGPNTLNLSLRMTGYKDKAVSVSLDGNSSTSVDLEHAETSPREVARKPAAKPAEPRKPANPRKPAQTTQDKEDEWRVH